MLRPLVLLFLTVAPAAMAQTAASDDDTMCATLYTYLADSARQYGMSGLYFDTAALKAQDAHLVLNPAENREHYTLDVINGAATIRDGLTRGTITTDFVMSTATRCNARYVQNPQAQAQDRSNDPQQTPYSQQTPLGGRYSFQPQ